MRTPWNGALAAFASSSVGAAAAVAPTAAVGLAATPLLYTLLGPPLLTAAVLALGLLATFQVDGALTADKLAYVGVFYTAVAFGLIRKYQLRSARVSAITATAMLIPPVLAGIGHVAIIDIGRDVLPYIMLTSGPLLALALWDRVSSKHAELLLHTAAAVAAASFIWTWAGRRGIFPTSGEPFAFPSIALVVASAALLFSGNLDGKTSRTRAAAGWALCSIGALTGTRSLLFLFMIPAINLLVSPSSSVHLGSRARRILAGLVTLAAVGGLLFALAPSWVETDAIERRMQATIRLTQAAETDQSYLTRLDGITEAVDRFRESPLVGDGFGSRIDATIYTSNDTYSSFNADNSITVLGKVGLVGFAALGLIALWFIRTAIGRLTVRGITSIKTLLIITGLSIPVRAAITDKGLVIAIALLMLAAPDAPRNEATHSASH